MLNWRVTDEKEGSRSSSCSHLILSHPEVPLGMKTRLARWASQSVPNRRVPHRLACENMSLLRSPPSISIAKRSLSSCRRELRAWAFSASPPGCTSPLIRQNLTSHLEHPPGLDFSLITNTGPLNPSLSFPAIAGWLVGWLVWCCCCCLVSGSGPSIVAHFCCLDPISSVSTPSSAHPPSPIIPFHSP